MKALDFQYVTTGCTGDLSTHIKVDEVGDELVVVIKTNGQAVTARFGTPGVVDWENIITAVQQLRTEYIEG